MLEQEIKDILAKNLPAQVGDVLQQRLAKADHLEQENAKLKTEIENLTAQRGRLLQQTTELAAEISMHKSISVRDEAVSKRERAMDVFEAKLRADEAEKRASELHGLVQTVFKSPVHRKTYMNTTFDGYDSQGRYITTGGMPSSTEESTD